MRAFNAPHQVRIHGPELRAIGDQTPATFLLPFQPPFVDQLLAQHVDERLEMTCVVARVSFHALGQRAPRPIRFLRALLQSDGEIFRDKIAEPKLLCPNESRRDHGVEDCRRHEAVAFAQQAQIVVGTVKDQFVFAEHSPQGREVKSSQRIDDDIRVFEAELDEAEFFGIGV